jgi:NAD(P)-dependent dehydrogenase (short-subunit alcohol dehydrogenase family)
VSVQLKGASVAITGGGRGIGLAAARLFRERGARVAIGDIEEALAEAAAEELGRDVHGFGVDVTGRESFAAFLAAAEAACGPLDVLVNNAGVMPTGAFLELDDSVSTAAIGVNLWGPINGMRLAIPGMLERGRGHVVNVASMMGKFHLPGVAVYGASKAACVSLSAAVREELRGTPVTITTILPSAAKTELISGIPIPRILPTVKPEQVAKAIVDSCKDTPAEASVPRWVLSVAPVSDLAPNRLVGLIRRGLGDDAALHADPEARAGYESRARKPG